MEMGSCGECGRELSAKALDKLEKLHGARVCPKCAPNKSRKPFVAAAQRASGLQGEDRSMFKKGVLEVKRDLKQKQTTAAPEKPKKWQAQSNALRDAMRSMREDAAAKASGKPLPQRAAAPAQVDPSFVQCPNCERRFNQSAAERHIPKCKDIKAQPKSLRRGDGTQLGASSRKVQGGPTATARR